MAGAAQWYLVENEQQVGPMELEKLLARLKQLGAETPIFGPGLKQWTAANAVPAVASRLSAAPGAAASFRPLCLPS